MAIIIGSTIFMLAALILLIIGLTSGKEDFTFVGVVISIFTILFGFGMLACIVPVDKEYEPFEIDNITRGKYNITAEYDGGKTVTSTDARFYNAEDADLEVIETKKFNSYGVKISHLDPPTFRTKRK